jgi:hypothetical protein
MQGLAASANSATPFTTAGRVEWVGTRGGAVIADHFFACRRASAADHRHASLKFELVVNLNAAKYAALIARVWRPNDWTD